MAARYEVTKKYAVAYAVAPKKGKPLVLGNVVEVTGWTARQQLVAWLWQPKGRARVTVAVIDRCKARGCKYSYDARLVLQITSARPPLVSTSTVSNNSVIRHQILQIVDWNTPYMSAITIWNMVAPQGSTQSRPAGTT